jgi:hypothetical protein
MVAPRSEFERELQLLETALRRLEADYNQFFAGRLSRLPWDQRARVDATMKRLDRMQIQNTGERFRFQSIQSRWAVFAELWERQLKAQETGRRSGRAVGQAAPHVPAPAAPPPSSARPRDRIVAVASLRDASAQADRVQSLYEQFAEARRDRGELPVPYERFSAMVQEQVKKLGSGGREVAFRVALKDGKVTLTAKPVGED